MGEGEQFVFLGPLQQRRVLRRGEALLAQILAPGRPPSSLPGSLFLTASLTQLCDPGSNFSSSAGLCAVLRTAKGGCLCLFIIDCQSLPAPFTTSSQEKDPSFRQR